MVNLILLITTSTTLFSLHKSTEGIALGYGSSLLNVFVRQEVEGSDSFVDYKAPKKKTKFVRKRILDSSQEGASFKEIENSRSLEAFDLDSFW